MATKNDPLDRQLAAVSVLCGLNVLTMFCLLLWSQVFVQTVVRSCSFV